MTQTETRDPDAIERDIRRTQEDMSETVNRLGDQMTPRRLFESLLDKADENGVDARYLLDGARRNPLALALISAGAIWLVSDYDAKPGAFTSNSNGGNGHDDHYDYDPDHRSYVEHMSRIGRNADEDDLAYTRRRDEHRGAYLMIERDHGEDDKSYRQRLDEATHKLREKRDSFAESARQSRQDMSRKGRQVARKGRQAYADNPLIGGLAAAIVGAIVGGVLPSTETEREQLGPQGATALDKAGETLHGVEEQARQKTGDAMEVAERKISESGNA